MCVLIAPFISLYCLVGNVVKKHFKCAESSLLFYKEYSGLGGSTQRFSKDAVLGCFVSSLPMNTVMPTPSVLFCIFKYSKMY